MPDKAQSDEEIIAAEQRFHRSLWRATLFLIPIGMAAGVLFGMAAHGGYIPAVLTRNPLPTAFLFGAVVVILMLPYMKRNWLPKEISLPRIQRKMIESRQCRSRRGTIYNIFWLPVMCALVLWSSHLDHSWGTDLNGWLLPGCFVWSAAMQIIVMLIGTKSLDELTREQWTRAMRLGFMLAIAGLCATFLVAITRPAWTAIAVPLVITAVMVSAQFHFLILDWRAGEGHE